MNCARMEKRILPYMDGRVQDAERQEVEKHLASCPVCRLRVDEFRVVSGLLGELPKIQPSEAFDVRLRARIAAEPARQSWWGWLAPSPRVAFAASLLLVLVVWTGKRPADSDTYPAHMAAATMGPDAQLRMLEDLPVLEDFDVLSSFEPLAELPPAVEADHN